MTTKPQLPGLEDVAGWAEISSDGRHRYLLGRQWNAYEPTVVWCLLNPSRADAMVNDQTVRKMVTFSRLHGYGSALIVNLFALRSTKPGVLGMVADPVGPENDKWIRTAICGGPRAAVVAAWGSASPLPVEGRVAVVRAACEAAQVPLLCLGRNGNGSPRHPCRLPYSTRLVPWS